MSYKAVFRSLHEVFPQVDIRILKAVAIEHSKDVDAAVEFILSEVIPSLSAPSEPSYTLTDVEEGKNAEAEAELKSLGISLMHGAEEANASPFSWPRHPIQNFSVSGHAKMDLHIKPIGMDEAAGSGSEVEQVAESEDKGFLLGHQEVIEEASSSTSFETIAATCENNFSADATSVTSLISCINEPVLTHCEDDSVQSSFTVESEVISSERRQLELNEDLPAASASIEHENSIMNQMVPMFAGNGIQDLYVSDMPSALSMYLQSSGASALEKNLEPIQPEARADDTSFSSVYVEASRLPMDNGAEQLVLDNENAIDDKFSATAKATQSGQVVSIDLLEEFITDAKSNKNTLISNMESIVDLMKEVEFHEKEANQAKEAASRAGLDILAKAEELKKMLKHAKEANNMHAGEVYGEKSILATEARELQSRLLSLSDERDKSLSIIEEMRHTLEARLAAADAERIDAEREKLEKGETARKVLIEQEVIMEKVVNESKRLEQEADENSKLREFLMDRGRMVDILQGEIAVVCEDVRTLKERVDGRHVPLTRSLSSSQNISILVSSSTSHSSTSSFKVLEPVQPSVRELTSQQLAGSPKSTDKSTVNEIDFKGLLDGWELFDGAV